MPGRCGAFRACGAGGGGSAGGRHALRVRVAPEADRRQLPSPQATGSSVIRMTRTWRVSGYVTTKPALMKRTATQPRSTETVLLRHLEVGDERDADDAGVLGHARSALGVGLHGGLGEQAGLTGGDVGDLGLVGRVGRHALVVLALKIVVVGVHHGGPAHIGKGGRRVARDRVSGWWSWGTNDARPGIWHAECDSGVVRRWDGERLIPGSNPF